MSDCLINLHRAYIPGEFGRALVPMIWICTASDDECATGVSGEVVDAMTSSIWFRDRIGWRAAWQLARTIRAGRTVTHSHLAKFASQAEIYAKFSPIHYLEAV